MFTYELYLLIIYVRVMNFFSDLLKAIVDFRMRKVSQCLRLGTITD